MNGNLSFYEYMLMILQFASHCIFYIKFICHRFYFYFCTQEGRLNQKG